MARRISDETGIACEWLLENNPKALPIAAFFTVRPNKSGRYATASVKRVVSMMRERGAPFTAETYREVRLLLDLRVPVARKTLYRDLGALYATVFYAWLRAIFSTEDADVAVWKTGKFLEGLAAEQGARPQGLKDVAFENGCIARSQIAVATSGNRDATR